MNASFCIRPFTHSSISPSGCVRLCCQAQGYLKQDGCLVSVETTPFEEIWNGRGYREIRRRMIAGEPVQECRACIHEEALTGESTRTRTLRDWRAGYLNARKTD